MNIFYVSHIDGDRAILDETESGHAVRVLRMRQGDRAVLADGKGRHYEAVVENAHPKHCAFAIEKVIEINDERRYELTVAMAPVKNNERTEWFLEKATEIGIGFFVPLLCRFSERKTINTERLKRIAVSAMKQSMKTHLPEISEITPFETFVKTPFDGKKLIAHCYEGTKPHIKERIAPGKNILILIGPEGDFSEEEVALAKANGFEEITLGKSRLRTETAALVACAAAALANS